MLLLRRWKVTITLPFWNFLAVITWIGDHQERLSTLKLYFHSHYQADVMYSQFLYSVTANMSTPSCWVVYFYNLYRTFDLHCGVFILATLCWSRKLAMDSQRGWKSWRNMLSLLISFYTYSCSILFVSNAAACVFLASAMCRFCSTTYWARWPVRIELLIFCMYNTFYGSFNKSGYWMGWMNLLFGPKTLLRDSHFL